MVKMSGVYGDDDGGDGGGDGDVNPPSPRRLLHILCVYVSLSTGGIFLVL